MKMVLWLSVTSLLLSSLTMELHSLQVQPTDHTRALQVQPTDNTTDGDVRLVGGTSRCAGKLELKNEGEWRPMNPNEWTNELSSVVCRQLNCGTVISSKQDYGSRREPSWWFLWPACNGSESSIRECGDILSGYVSSGLQLICSALQVQDHTKDGDVRLVGGTSHCAGKLEFKNKGEWRPMNPFLWTIKLSSIVCRQLDCGTVVSSKQVSGPRSEPLWWIINVSKCDGSESSIKACGTKKPDTADYRLELVCSEAVRLVDGTSSCSGRVEVKSNQSWVSVCEGDFDQHDAEVVCRELGCGAPSVLQGALYGQAKAPMSTKEFQCEGSESALVDCRTSDSIRNTCSPDKAVGLSCSEPDVRLVGGTSHCLGRVETKHEGEWRLMSMNWWNLKSASVVCRQLDCGSAVSIEVSSGSEQAVWRMSRSCVGSESSLKECGTKRSKTSTERMEVVCSESVRLVNGPSSCSGRVEVKSTQSWVSVCKDDFDQQDAEVVCRELGCGAPSVLQGALYGEVKAPMLTKEFQCEGNESALLDCTTSDSTRNTCSPDKTVGLTCSEPEYIRLVGSNCTGTLEMKHQGQWSPVDDYYGWKLESAIVVCRQLNCGSAVSTQSTIRYHPQGNVHAWRMISNCDGSEPSLRECGTRLAPTKSYTSRNRLDVICTYSTNTNSTNTTAVQPPHHTTATDHVRLVGGSRPCTGKLEVKHMDEWYPINPKDWNQKLSSIACGELNCGPAVSTKWSSGSNWEPLWSLYEEYDKGWCAVLRDCGRFSEWGSESRLELTCSGSVRLAKWSTCSGTVEVKSNQSWVSVCEGDFDQRDAKVVCMNLNCGALLGIQVGYFSYGDVEAPMSTKGFQCEGTESALQDCRTTDSTRNTCSRDKTVGLTCSDSDVRLVGATSRCAGRVEMKNNGEWRLIDLNHFGLRSASVVCRELDCGSAVSTKKSTGSKQSVWWLTSTCDGSESSLRECGSYRPSEATDGRVEVICSESVRLVNGTSSCSGRVEVKSDQSWVSVCEGDFDQQDAEVVCRELGCGAPSVLQGALYGEAKAPISTKEFQCKGSESALQDCRTSNSTRNPCSPDKTVGLTCSASGVRLVGGTSHCNGIFEMQHQGKWRTVYDYYWNQQTASVVCNQLNCGSLVSTKDIPSSRIRPYWLIRSSCKSTDSSLRECILTWDDYGISTIEVICSDDKQGSGFTTPT